MSKNTNKAEALDLVFLLDISYNDEIIAYMIENNNERNIVTPLKVSPLEAHR